MNIEKRLSIWRIPIVGKTLFYRLFVKQEGGELTSDSLRELIYRNYKVRIGKYTYGGCFQPDFNYQLGGEVEIGMYCSVAGGVHYYAANHPINSTVMSPYFYNRNLGLDVKDVQRNKLIIGNDVWCGGNVLITSGCQKIGNGAVIGAGTVVTKDVPPYAVVVGNPGRIVKYRFTEEIREKIEESQWWLLEPKQLFDFYQYMNDPLCFCERIKEQTKHEIGQNKKCN